MSNVAMKLELTVDPSHPLVMIYVNGTLAGEVVIDRLYGRDTLQAELTAARWAKALPRLLDGAMDDLRRIANIPDHINIGEERRRNAFIRGFSDGWAGRTVPHPTEPSIPGIPPEHSPGYRLGYDHGEALRRVREKAACEP